MRRSLVNFPTFLYYTLFFSSSTPTRTSTSEVFRYETSPLDDASMSLLVIDQSQVVSTANQMYAYFRFFQQIRKYNFFLPFFKWRKLLSIPCIRWYVHRNKLIHHWNFAYSWRQLSRSLFKHKLYCIMTISWRLETRYDFSGDGEPTLLQFYFSWTDTFQWLGRYL